MKCAFFSSSVHWLSSVLLPCRQNEFTLEGEALPTKSCAGCFVLRSSKPDNQRYPVNSRWRRDSSLGIAAMNCYGSLKEAGHWIKTAGTTDEEERLHGVLLTVVWLLGTMLQMWWSIAAAAMVDVGWCLIFCLPLPSFCVLKCVINKRYPRYFCM
jgi:hypothetical protein